MRRSNPAVEEAGLRFEHPLAKEAGGLPGAPVRDPANAVIRRAWQRTVREAVGAEHRAPAPLSP